MKFKLKQKEVLMVWKRCFVFWPRKTQCGHWVMFHTVERKYNMMATASKYMYRLPSPLPDDNNKT